MIMQVPEITVVILLIYVTTAHSHVEFLEISPSFHEVVKFTGESHIVICDGKYKMVHWLNPRNRVVQMRNENQKVFTEEKNGTLALVFTSIDKNDKGSWTCMLKGSDLRNSFKMNVNEPISFTDTSVHQNLTQDIDGFLRCNIEGNPEPIVSWYFNGLPIIFPSEKYTKIEDGLWIKRVSRNDNGEFICKAFQFSDHISKVDELRIRLTVNFKPILPMIISSDMVYAFVPSVINLTCEAEAEPKPNFDWFKDGKLLNSKTNRIFYNSYESSIQILANNSYSFGNYTCKASNKLGYFDRVISLRQGTQPKPPPIFELRGVNYDTLDVDVGAVKSNRSSEMDISDYRFQIISIKEFYKNGANWTYAIQKDFPFQYGITYLLTNLTPNTNYLVRVAARNYAGFSNWTENKQFKTTTGIVKPNHSSAIQIIVPNGMIIMIVCMFYSLESGRIF